MTPLQLFLVSIVSTHIFKVFTKKENLENDQAISFHLKCSNLYIIRGNTQIVD